MYLNIIIKTFFLYFFIIIMYRIMGKKELGELGIGDLTVSILIAELAAISIDENEKSILFSIIPILIIVFLEVILSYISLKSEKIRSLIDGKPSVVIKDGKVNLSIMSKIRYTIDDLITQLREKGIKSIEEVDYAILENSGTLSVFKNANTYPMPFILDGVIDYTVLREIGKDKTWIYSFLKREHFELSDIFYAFYTKEKTYIIRKNELL